MSHGLIQSLRIRQAVYEKSSQRSHDQRRDRTVVHKQSVATARRESPPEKLTYAAFLA